VSPRRAWLPFLLFVALLASGFVVFGRSEKSGASPAPPPHDAGCPEESDAVPLPAPSDLRAMEDELFRSVTVTLTGDLALSGDQAAAVRRAIGDGLAEVRTVWRTEDPSTRESDLQSVYAKTRASLESLLTPAQWHRLQNN
jgi:hypothetical protein